MMMGPTKKKVFSAGLICFLIPVIAGTIFFMKYKNEKEAEIADLKVKSQTITKFAFSEPMAAGEVITPDDIALVEVKYESNPSDSFEEADRESLINRRVLIDAEANTVITESMLFPEADPLPKKDLRLEEFNMITLPSDVKEGDFLDFRVTLPGGENYLVVSGKEVKKIGEGDDTNTVFVELDEEEIIRTTAALIESYMTLGSEVYANKYVNPNVQLYDNQRVDLVQVYKDTVEEISKEKEAALSGEGLKLINESGEEVDIKDLPSDGVIVTPLGKVTLVDGKPLVTNQQVADRIGVDVKVIEAVIGAIESNDSTLLAEFDHWLIKKRLYMENTYPVKPEIAKLIIDNPNILKELSAKYDIAKLEEQRANIVELPLYTYDVDYDGKVTITEEDTLTRIQDAINNKIETQRIERKEYIQNLLIQQSAGTTTQTENP